MPRWASRLAREIVRVRVERVQDITEADAVACGGVGMLVNTPSYVRGYFNQWDPDHKPGQRVANNPWVSVYDLKGGGK
jgi:hypothetical protein